NRHIPLDEKLTALQQADPSRRWSSLDDNRICTICEKVITGRMIDVWQDARGAYHLHCPTSGCEGTPQDWFPHGVGHARPPSILGDAATSGLGLALS
ncbi:MAG: hypothetical protein M3429_10935, partial [Verrucomicrobiota bacterium]|nr:hypothetical protein [Verrucomicrobiota bacterium]